MRSTPGLTTCSSATTQLLREVHQVAVVRVRPVELDHRELGVVPRGQPLVAEIPVDLVDLLEPADDQALEVELRRDAQEHLHVERVVVRDEGPGRGAAGNRLHHRRLHFHEAAIVELPAQLAHELRARAEHGARIVVDDEVDVALAIARVDIREAVPLVGQRSQRLRQQAQRGDLHRQLAGARAEQRALGAERVAHVPALEIVVDAGQRRRLQEQLDAPARIRERREARLAHDALGHHAARDGHADRGGLELFGRRHGVRGLQRARVVRAAEIVGIGDASGTKRS